MPHIPSYYLDEYRYTTFVESLQALETKDKNKISLKYEENYINIENIL